MCEGATIALGVAAAASLAGGAIKAKAARDAGQAQGAILDENAVLAEQAAGDAVNRGALAAGRIRLEGGRLQAKQRAQYASSGVDVQAGSAVDVVADTSALSGLDAEIAQNNAMREAWGLRKQAGQFRKQAKLARDSGDSSAVASILGGIGGAASYGAPLLKVK